MNYLRIPEERVGVLIGEKGKVKRRIEGLLEVKITVDDTLVSVDGEGLNTMRAHDIVLAIGRGFSPERAFNLLVEDSMIDVIPLSGFSPKKMARMKGRLIGKDGRSRKVIENLTGACISVYGKTISILGPYDAVEDAKKAINMLLDGSPHANVYKLLESSRSSR